MRICEWERHHQDDKLEELECLVVRLVGGCRKLRRDGLSGWRAHIHDMEMQAFVLLQQLESLRRRLNAPPADAQVAPPSSSSFA